MFLGLVKSCGGLCTILYDFVQYFDALFIVPAAAFVEHVGLFIVCSTGLCLPLRVVGTTLRCGIIMMFLSLRKTYA